MKTLANYTTFRLTLFTLLIGLIQSLNSGESVYNKNVVVLDATSTDWKFRQETDPLSKFDKSLALLKNQEKPDYFLIDELDNLNLVFKENVTYAPRFSDELDKCKRLNVTYSFDYYLDLFPTVKILRWSIELLDQRTILKPVAHKQWTTVSDSSEISLRRLRTKFSESEMFEMYINTLDRSGNDKFRNSFESKFAIKNLRLVLECSAARTERNFRPVSEANADQPFTFERNNQRLNGSQQLDFWSNQVFPQFIRGSVEKYYYTEKSDRQLNFIVSENDFQSDEDVCLTFDYFVSKNASLTVRLHKADQKQLIKLYTSEFNERLVNDEVARKQVRLQWNNATVCVKGSELLANEKHQLPQWDFHSFIHRPERKSNIVAVTNFRVGRRPIEPKDFIPSWKSNGESGLHSWKTVPETENFRLNLADNHELKLYLRELPSDSIRHYYVISDWIQIDTNVGYLTFKVNSNLTDYQLRLKVEADALGTVDERTWRLDGAIVDQVFQYNFKNSRIRKRVPEKFKAKIVFEIYNNQVLRPNDLSKSNANEFRKHRDEQLLTISEIQMADRCTDELICNNNGNCKSLAANKAECKCKSGWHGTYCEFENVCEKQIKIGDFTLTGNAFCKLQKRECIADGPRFSCKCENDEYWNSQKFECQQVNLCTFKFCGLNEVCRMENEKAVCDCAATFRRKNDICIKDLCLDPRKKCPENQRCMHVENEVNPICYCPHGFFKRNDQGECIDNRKAQPNELRNAYDQTNPFMLQKHGCEQDYVIENDKVTCSCLPGYSLSENGQCKSTFDADGCGCNDNQICIQQDGKKKCICKAGFFGDDCKLDICSEDKAADFCGWASCSVTPDSRFNCDCNEDLYTPNENGLCEFKKPCTENAAVCGEEAVCFNQRVVKYPGVVGDIIIPSCGCKRPLKGSADGKTCVDPCSTNDACNKQPFTQCVYLHDFDEIRCNCVPGFWRKNILADPCSPVKSSLSMRLTMVPMDTNVSPVRKKDRSRNKRSFFAFATSFDESSFNTTAALKQLRTTRSPRKGKDRQKETAPGHIPIGSQFYPCLNDLDLEGCVNQWNSAYQAANRLPAKPLAKEYVRSMLRKSLLNTFNIVFGNNQIQDVNVVDFIGNGTSTEQFGLKTVYVVDFVLQSNDLDLKEDMVRAALDKKCIRKDTKSNGKTHNICVIEEQSLLLLNRMEFKAFDLCENTLKCSDRSYCYSRRKDDPTFDFEKDKVAYECRCKDGFESTHVNEVGFLSFLNHTCEDIDECASLELNDCDDQSTTCENLIGSYRCKCDKGYKRHNKTSCIELCSASSCLNGKCEKFGDHDDFCKCYDDWTGIKCDQPNSKLNTYKNTTIIVIVVSIVLLILTVVGLVLYGRNYSEKRTIKRTDELRRELELSRLDNQRILRTTSSSQAHLKHIEESPDGNDNPAFDGQKS